MRMALWAALFVLALAPIAGGPLSLEAQEGRQQMAGHPRVPTSGGAHTAQAGGERSSAIILVESDEDYRIAPGDVIDVQVEDAPELSRTFRVSAAGTFLMPYLGRIVAQQKTTEELAKLIADGLRGRYLKQPQVTVVVRQYNSYSFFIQGAVRHPGVYQIQGRPSLLKLITIAGGLADNHGSSAFIIREIKQPQAPNSATEDGAKYELIKANISALFKGSFDQDIFVEPGDIINIPPTDVFFVAGEVHAPGSFPLKEGTTLRQAISLAQGTTFKAATNRGVIFREGSADGKRQEIKVDISEVMGGKKEDIPIVANDIIIIPNSRFKSVSGALLSAFGFSAARAPLRY